MHTVGAGASGIDQPLEHRGWAHTPLPALQSVVYGVGAPGATPRDISQTLPLQAGGADSDKVVVAFTARRCRLAPPAPDTTRAVSVVQATPVVAMTQTRAASKTDHSSVATRSSTASEVGDDSGRGKRRKIKV